VNRRGPRILLVEDNPADAGLVREYLRDWHRPTPELVHAVDLAAAELAVDGAHFDVVLLDCRLPDAQGLDGCRRLLAVRTGLPIVLLTGMDDEELALQAIEVGVQDYLTKDRLEPDLLQRTIRYSIERQHALTELRTRSAELERANRVLTTFLTNASHELRTPMAGVLAATELLAEHGACESPDLVAEFACDIGMAARRLNSIVDRILQLAELQSLAQPLQRQPLDLAHLLRSLVAEQVSVRPGRTRIVLHGVEQPLEVHGDAALLQRLFAELLDNAVRHPPAGGEVTITLAHERNGCDVLVDDDGPGIPDPERRRLVFEPFYQTGEVLTDKPPGVGLGLTIAREIALLHGGSLECLESPQGGARFRVRLCRGQTGRATGCAAETEER
jgi:signal transduction histidine kinase